METLNILDDILLKARGYEVALLTTFNFEIPFFERNILSRLENNNVRTFGLFVDSKNYIDAINSVESSSIGKKYVVSEVDINASFHPKMILLLGDKKAKLIVTSANLTFTGYCYNNEIFNVFDYDADNIEYLSVIKSAYLYFKNLNSLYNKFDNDLFSKLSEYNYLHRAAENSNVKFWSNYNDSIIDQIVKLDLNIKQIDIAVPFYDNELNALKKLKELYPFANINLYIQNKFSTFNFKLNEIEGIIARDNLYVFDGFKEVGTAAIYHGKVFRFNTDSESYILYGSANCTEAALMKSSVNGGNYECDILEKGSLNEFDYFFNNFTYVDIEEELSNRSIIYNNNKKYNFKHILSEDTDRIHIKYKNKWNNLDIFINDKKQKFKYIENEIIIEVDEDVPYGIFRIDFVNNEEKESINAFIIFKNVIEEYRKSTNKDLSVTLDKINNSKSIEYIKYYKMLLDLVPYDVESLNEFKDNNDIYNEAVKQNESDDDFDEEFVVDFDIPDEILNKQREYNRIESIKKGIISNFAIRILSAKKNGMHGRNLLQNLNVDSDSDVLKIVVPLPEEEKFARFIKRLFKNILNIKYLEKSNIKDYINNVLLLINVIYTYNKDNSSNAFEISNFNELLLNFFEIIQKQDLSVLDEEMICILNVLLFVVLLQFSFESDGDDKSRIVVSCRNILLNYDRMFNLKNDYEDILDCVLELVSKELSFEDGKVIIEKYFNYKNEDELYNLIKDKINSNVSIEPLDRVLVVNAKTNEIGKYMNIHNIILIFTEVKNRYKHTKEFDTFLVNIVNDNIDPKLPNPIESVRYIYNISSSVVERHFKNKYDKNYKLVSSERI